MTLTEFLLARIAEDETWLSPPTSRRMIGGEMVEIPVDRIPAFVERDRKRWAAECEAKRRIMGVHASCAAQLADIPISTCSECGGTGDLYGGVAMAWPCGTLRLLALPYADHPDYDETWRP